MFPIPGTYVYALALHLRSCVYIWGTIRVGWDYTLPFQMDWKRYVLE